MLLVEDDAVTAEFILLGMRETGRLMSVGSMIDDKPGLLHTQEYKFGRHGVIFDQ